MSTEVIIPPLGESITEATVGQWLKQPGDAVAADEPIVSLETDKVAVEVPSPLAGTMGEHLFKVGDTVAVGRAIARIEAGGATPAAKTAPTPAVLRDAEPTSPASDTDQPIVTRATADTPLSPSVRRVVEERGLDPATLPHTGPGARITKADALAAAPPLPTREGAEAPGPTLSRKGEGQREAQGEGGAERREERVRMTRLRQTIARRLKEAQNTAAMLTTFNDVDMTAVMRARDLYKDAFEKKHQVRLGFMSFFTKAAVLVLREVPAVNAMIDGEEIVYRQYADIGVAVSSPGGLVVPILKNADHRSFADIEKAIADFGKRARDGQLKLEELQGGTFTISNGGVFGSLMSTPILNPPQSGVLGLHRIEQRPVVKDGQIVARPMMYLALSYDHRVVDGREAVTFLVRIKEAIEDPTRLLLDL